MHSHRLYLLVGFAFVTACAGGEDDPAMTSFDITTTGPAEETGEPPMMCLPGVQSPCECPGGGDGLQVCEPDGLALSECECIGVSDSADSTGSAETTGETTGEPDPCGDLTCADDETCNTCPEDCGECVPCTSAPSCEGAQIPPVIDTHADALDDIVMMNVSPEEAFATIVAQVQEARPGMRVLVAALAEPVEGEDPFVGQVRAAFAANPAPTAALRRQLAQAGLGDATTYRQAFPEPRRSPAALADQGAVQHGGLEQPCENPRLRVRVAQITVVEDYDDTTDDAIYCLITSEGTETSELRLTPVTPALDVGANHEFALGEGIVWGQMDLAAPKGNLALTYNCIESDDLTIYNGLIEAIGDAAEMAGGVAGDSGWVFDAVGVISNLLPSVLALDGDDQLFNAQQIIPEDQHLALTQGAYWIVERGEYDTCFVCSDWGWQLRMEIWGCHDNGQ